MFGDAFYVQKDRLISFFKWRHFEEDLEIGMGLNYTVGFVYMQGCYFDKCHMESNRVKIALWTFFKIFGCQVLCINVILWTFEDILVLHN